METYLSQYKQHLKALGYSPSARRNLPPCLEEFLGQLRENGVHSIEGIAPRHIAAHYGHLSSRPNKKRGGGLGSGTVAQHLYAIRLFLNSHEQYGTATENPISGLDFPRAGNQQRETLTIQETKELYGAAANYREKAILGIFYGCGLRRGEGAALDIKDISFKNRLLYVREGKGKKRRAVPISAGVLQDLKHYLYKERLGPNSQPALLTNSRGHRASGASHNKTVKALVKKAGIGKCMSLHGLRHSIATHLLQNGLGAEQVRGFLGHKRLDTTQLYTRAANHLPPAL